MSSPKTINEIRTNYTTLKNHNGLFYEHSYNTRSKLDFSDRPSDEELIWMRTWNGSNDEYTLVHRKYIKLIKKYLNLWPNLVGRVERTKYVIYIFDLLNCQLGKRMIMNYPRFKNVMEAKSRELQLDLQTPPNKYSLLSY